MGEGEGRADVAGDHHVLLHRQRPFVSSRRGATPRSEEHTSELQSLMRISYAVFCLKKKKQQTHHNYALPNANHFSTICLILISELNKTCLETTTYCSHNYL